MVVSDRFFFITCRVHRLRGELNQAEFAILAEVVRERRKAHRFLLTAWGFSPRSLARDHFPAIAAHHIQGDGGGQGGRHEAHQRRSRRTRRAASGALSFAALRTSFDRALRTVKECNEKVAYIDWNPVKAGLVKRPEEWKWSSIHDYTGTVNAPSGRGSPIPVDRILMPSDERTRI